MNPKKLSGQLSDSRMGGNKCSASRMSRHKDNVRFLSSSHSKALLPKRVEDLMGVNLFTGCSPSKQVPHEKRAYNTAPNWFGGIYPTANYRDRVQQLLGDRDYGTLVIQASGCDLTNIKNLPKQERDERAALSSMNTIEIVELALYNRPTLTGVVIIPRTPRIDHAYLTELTESSNVYLDELVRNSRYNHPHQSVTKITMGPLNYLRVDTERQRLDLFGRVLSKPCFDGIHMRGPHGKELYTSLVCASIEKHLCDWH